MNKKIAWLGIIGSTGYVCTVGFYLLVKTSFALTLWEVITIISAPLMILILNEIAGKENIDRIKHILMLLMLSNMFLLTTVAHVVNISVTRKLESQGVNVPDYFRIGQFPSVEMSIDYIGWGLFLGLGFLILAIGMQRKNLMRSTLYVCAILCFVGFIGSFFNEKGWYAAPMGYGFGTLVLSIEMLLTAGKNSKKDLIKR